MVGVPTNEDEVGLRRLAAQLRAKQIVVKLFLCHPLHAKLYLLFRPDPISPTIGYLGSSNLTLRMSSIQEILQAGGISWISSYESDSNPGQLFDGVKQNMSILLHRSGNSPSFYTTRLLRFFSDARDFVFPAVRYVATVNRYLTFGFPKASEPIEHTILQRMFLHPPLAALLSGANGSPIYVHRIAHYYIKCFDFVPYFRSDRDGVKKSEDYKEYLFRRPTDPVVSVINGSTFYFYWQMFYDSFKAGKECVESFPCSEFSSTSIHDKLIRLCRNLMKNMKKNSRRLRASYSATGSVEYDKFYPRNSKSIIDEIELVLAKHYDFTDDESTSSSTTTSNI